MSVPVRTAFLADVAQLREVAQIPGPARLLPLRPLLVEALTKARRLPEGERAAAGQLLAEAVRPRTSGAGSVTTLRYSAGDIGGPTA